MGFGFLKAEAAGLAFVHLFPHFLVGIFRFRLFVLPLFLSGATLVLLDEHGKELRSVELAKWLEQKQQTARRLVFAIGGPYGFSEAVYTRANEKLSLSRLTFSHQMVRLVFTEQIYRACTIIKGEPYHHE